MHDFVPKFAQEGGLMCLPHLFLWSILCQYHQTASLFLTDVLCGKLSLSWGKPVNSFSPSSRIWYEDRLKIDRSENHKVLLQVQLYVY